MFLPLARAAKGSSPCVGPVDRALRSAWRLLGRPKETLEGQYFKHVRPVVQRTNHLARAEPGTSAQTYSGHAKCYWYSLTGCPFRMLSKVILLPVSSSPRLISGIPVTGFRWEANHIHFGRCASSFPLARASLGSQKTSFQRSGHVCREGKKSLAGSPRFWGPAPFSSPSLPTDIL